MANSFYLTTAIDYPNGEPHIGHVYEKIVTDAYARWYRLHGKKVYFLTGTDENGQKLVKAAEAAGQGTKEYIDANVAKFRKVCLDLHLTHDDFIRTTEPRHIETTQAFWRKQEANGDIYFDRYSGLYCYSCEAFYLEGQAENKKCPVHLSALEFVSEDGYFLRLSKYRDWISDHIVGHEKFIFPRSARKHILSRLEKEDLKDLSISRPNAGWGIPVPSNNEHVIYTWFDALINYYSAVNSPDLEHLWPANMHVIGKDISWFHCVIWPVMLKSAGFAIPEQVYVHGFVLGEDGRKMSKSLGNVADPYDVIGKFPLDLLRYYLLRAIVSGADGCFSVKDMMVRHNSELANDFGNLVLRVIKLAKKRLGDVVDLSDVSSDFDFVDLGRQMMQQMNDREHSRALDLLWAGINRVNAYLNAHEPWRIKDDVKKFKQIIGNGLYAIHSLAILMQPFLPDTAQRTMKMLGSDAGFEGLKFANYRFQLGEPETLFVKYE